MSGKALATAASILTSASALAIPGADPVRPAPVSLAGPDMVQWTLGLLVVLGAILGCAWLLRKIGQLPAAAGLGLRIIGGVSVGTRERVLVLQAGKKQLVLGVAPGLIEMLCVLEESDGLVAPQPESKSPGGFAEQLRQTLRGGSNG